MAVEVDPILLQACPTLTEDEITSLSRVYLQGKEIDDKRVVESALDKYREWIAKLRMGEERIKKRLEEQRAREKLDDKQIERLVVRVQKKLWKERIHLSDRHERVLRKILSERSFKSKEAERLVDLIIKSIIDERDPLEGLPPRPTEYNTLYEYGIEGVVVHMWSLFFRDPPKSRLTSIAKHVAEILDAEVAERGIMPILMEANKKPEYEAFFKSFPLPE